MQAKNNVFTNRFKVSKPANEWRMFFLILKNKVCFSFRKFNKILNRKNQLSFLFLFSS